MRFALAACVAAVYAAAGLRADVQTATRELVVSVCDAGGEPAANLQAGEVIVRESGLRREVVRVRPAGDDLDVVLLLDNSEGSASVLEPMRRGVSAFLEAMPATARAAILTFGDGPAIIEDLTSDRGVLEKGLQRIAARPGAGAYLIDALARVSQSAAEGAARRLVFVVVATEHAEYSSTEPEAALTRIRESHATLNAFVFAGTRPATVSALGGGIRSGLDRRHERLAQMTPANDASRQRDELLRRVSDETGGKWARLRTPDALQPALGDLARALRGGYIITYARPGGEDDDEPTMQVEITRGGTTVKVGGAEPCPRSY
jgi:hypothetical protein